MFIQSSISFLTNKHVICNLNKCNGNKEMVRFIGMETRLEMDHTYQVLKTVITTTFPVGLIENVNWEDVLNTRLLSRRSRVVLKEIWELGLLNLMFKVNML